MDSFTKTVSVLALPNREAATLAPRLLDEIFFRRGAPDVLHNDEAQEFMSELLAHLTAATGTTRTTTCGHNAQSNGEIDRLSRNAFASLTTLSHTTISVTSLLLKWTVKGEREFLAKF